MNTELWQKIQEFDFDDSDGDYTFSIRLAKENNWTHHFTQQALLEYRKFMYLAATSNTMVSPSEIVDVVWHQHLIFSKSYEAFCLLLGKNIQHIPSTHSRQEMEKFRQAKENTTLLYNAAFGNQPRTIWETQDIFESLNLPKARLKHSTVLTIGIIIWLALLLPAYYLLKPLLIRIQNPWFIIGYVSFAGFVWLLLQMYNNIKLSQLIKETEKDAFIHNLSPYELIYAKTGSLDYVIHGCVNELMVRNVIKINPKHTVALTEKATPPNPEQTQVISVLEEFEWISYHRLVKLLTNKPLFNVISKSMDALQLHIKKSQKHVVLFTVNLLATGIVLLPGYIRFFTGLSRHKPVINIAMVCVALTILGGYHLLYLSNIFFRKTLPKVYMQQIGKNEFNSNWQWLYYAKGTAVLYPAFIPLVKHNPNAINGGSDSGSSCGSSCGSGCGGCGGD